MKTTTMWVIAIALVAATGCSETETEVIDSGGDDQVALGISPNLKVEAGTRSATKSVVSGDLITYANYTTEAPGLGVLITNKAANGWYTPDGTDYTGHHVWYMGDERGANWISIQTKGATFADTNESPYYLTKDIGRVYAYYPYDVNALSSLLSINSESDLKIPITVIASGEMDASANNANKIWNATSWSANKNKGVSLSLTTEKDYLYFDGTEGGRNVNNGRAKGQTPFDPESGPNNTDANNPGYLINLAMKHAMAMVSFRVYDGGNLSDNDVNFTKFEIKNHQNSSNLFKTGTGKMALADGAISDNSTTGALSRTITNYVLMKQIKEGEQSDKAFIEDKTTTGQAVSKKVSAIVYPIAGFGDNEIDVVITLQEGGNTPVEYTVTLPAHEWTAGSNCIYTFSAGRNKLTVMDVTVEDWVEDEQPDISL